MATRVAPIAAAECAALPRLAWLFERRCGETPRLLHGPGVLVRPTGFFEGAWSGDFDDFAFHEAANVFGSGAVATERGVLFVPPSHTQEHLLLWRGPAGIGVSNSLAFLLRHFGDDLAPFDWDYGERFARVLDDPEESPLEFPTRDGSLSLLLSHNALLDDAGRLEIVPKPPAPGFADYRSYRTYLQREIGAAIANAAAPARAQGYGLLATLSSGYDSTAVAALASAEGCEKAISFGMARSGVPDSGEATARALGMKLTVLERCERPPRSGDTEAEFLAGGMQGEDIFMAALERIVPGRILFTGYGGDAAWKPGGASNRLKRLDLSGADLGEFRLRSDFIHLPAPFIGLANKADLARVTKSAEMAPFSVGGDYDRPIPRRIAEEAGVPRDAFGSAKKAVSVHLFLDPTLLSDRARAEVRNALSRMPAWHRLRYELRAARFDVSRSFLRWAGRIHRVCGAKGEIADDCSAGRLFRLLFGDRNAIIEHSHPRNTILQRWALAGISARYDAPLPR